MKDETELVLELRFDAKRKEWVCDNCNLGVLRHFVMDKESTSYGLYLGCGAP